MKQSAGTKAMFPLTSNQKSKKLPKDREKRKSQNQPNEKGEPNNNGDKGSPSKDITRKYAGIGPDSIHCYFEQTCAENLNNEVCYGFAEDMSYRLRFIMNDALIKARLCGRNVITSSDIDATFESLNLEKVYGAPTNPNWMPLSDQNLFYLDDQVVNLIELAEKEEYYQQAGDPVLIRKWLPEARESNGTLRLYFEVICKSVLSNNPDVRQLALKDLRENCLIGPIVEWFYHFGYFLLSKDITYDCLTLSALDLIRALEENCIAPQIVSERQLSLLVRLILQRLLRSVTTEEVLKPMCMVLAILCNRVPLKEIVILKTLQKFSEIKDCFSLPIINIVNAIGYEAIEHIFLPNLEYIMTRVEHDDNQELRTACLQTYDLICSLQMNTTRIDKTFHNFYGDSLVIIWKSKQSQNDSPDVEESNWLNIKVQLLKSRRKIIYYSANKKDPSADQMFESDYTRLYRGPFPVDLDYIDSHKFKSTFHETAAYPEKLKGCKKFVIHPKRSVIRYTPPVKVEDIDLKHEFFSTDILMPDLGDSKIKESLVEIGKRSLLLPVLKNYKNRSRMTRKCYDHSLAQCNL